MVEWLGLLAGSITTIATDVLVLVVAMIDWLDLHSGSVMAMATVILVFVTGFYALRTHGIARETKRQAEASVRMAEEMEKSRRPGLDLYCEILPPQSGFAQYPAAYPGVFQGFSIIVTNV